MREFPDTELSRRLRANWGRRLRPDFADRMEATLGYRPIDADFVDLEGTAQLHGALHERLLNERPSRTWPDAQRADLCRDLARRAQRIGRTHTAYLLYFEDWEYLGALRVPSAAALPSAVALIEEGPNDALALVARDLTDGLFLDYSEEQVDGGEYKLYYWGEFAKVSE